MKFNGLISFALLAALFSCETSGSGIKEEKPGSDASGNGNVEVIYEANPKVFAEHGAFDAISDRLDEIQALGTTILWLMPIYEPGELNAIGSPYCVKDYKAVNPDFGTMEELKALIDKAHGLGMKVILDWVANHTSWDNAWITEHKDWYTQDAAGNIVSPSGWNDVADLNYDNAALRSAMTDAMTYWVTEVGADGFRCDFAEGVPFDFWSSAIAGLRKLTPSLIMLAEGGSEAAGLFDCGFDMVYGWSFADKLGEVFSGVSPCSELYTVNEEEFAVTPAGKQRMRYSTNHDRTQETATAPVTLYKTKDGAMAAFVAAAFMGGIPMIYSSQETGYLDSFSIFGYNVMDWDSDPDAFQEYVDIMKIYKESADMRGVSPKCFDIGNVLAFSYITSADTGLFVVINPVGADATVKTPMEMSGRNVRNMMSGEDSVLESVIGLEPYEYLIYKML